MPLQIVRQDITKMQVDAIVNTTNENKIGYSGVDLAVHTAAGIELDNECAKLPPLGLGQVQITGGYNLPCKYVIHTSGPTWEGGLKGESIILRSCYLESLKMAVEHGCQTVAFPLISSGSYGYPKERVLKFAIQVITEFLEKNELTVYICVFDKQSYTFSQELYGKISAFIHNTQPTQTPLREKRDSNVSFSRTMRVQPTTQSERIRSVSPTPPSTLCEERHSIFPSPAMTPADRRRNKETLILSDEPHSAIGKTLGEYVSQLDRGFQETLFDLIDKSGMTDVECYKRANVDKRVFSKLKSNKNYRPSKQTAVAFAIALRLNIVETQKLLSTAGFTLSKSNAFDMIIRYFILNKNYNIFDVNEALFEFDQVLLGSGS